MVNRSSRRSNEADYVFAQIAGVNPALKVAPLQQGRTSMDGANVG